MGSGTKMILNKWNAEVKQASVGVEFVAFRVWCEHNGLFSSGEHSVKMRDKVMLGHESDRLV